MHNSLHKPLLLAALTLLLLSACRKEYSNTILTTDTGSDPSLLYDQGHTPVCWIYAMCACIEREALHHGDSITLSRQWLLARLMEEETTREFLTTRSNGKTLKASEEQEYVTDQEGHGAAQSDSRMAFSLRGVGPDALRLIRLYGLLPYQHERSRVEAGNVMVRRLTAMTQTARSLSQLRDDMSQILPHFTVARESNRFVYYSMTYTPKQFAESIMYRQQWEFLASVDYHPWGERFALEVEDNHLHHLYLNMPIDTLLNRTVSSLRNGHPVYWEYGDPLPPTRKGSKRGGATSRHAMAIIRLVKDKKGKEWLLCQNSYGNKWGNHGRCLISKDFFLKHTCNVGIVECRVKSEE